MGGSDDRRRRPVAETLLGAYWLEPFLDEAAEPEGERDGRASATPGGGHRAEDGAGGERGTGGGAGGDDTGEERPGDG